MIESFQQFSERVPSFDDLSPTDKITHAAWYLHSRKGIESISTSDLNECFSQIHITPPHTSVYLKRLAERKPPTFLRSKAGYRLEGKVRKSIEAKFGESSSTVVISVLLRGLSDQISTPEERLFLAETLKCYSVHAFRASIVMAWNLAYSHIESWIIGDPDKIKRFNISYEAKFLKRQERVSDQDSFSEFKEFDVIETLAHAKLISKNVSELLKEKLKRRNAAAHPSLIEITQAQTDDIITDLVNNVVAKLG